MPRKSNPNIKIQNEITQFTEDDLLEFDKCIEDELYCIKKYYKIEHPTRGVIPFDLYDFQEEAIKLMQQHRYVVLLFPRQCGKTTISGAHLLYFAMMNENVTILVVSYKSDLAKEVIKRIKFTYENLPFWLKPGITEDGWNKHSIRFDNGSSIVSQTTSENSGRGLSISLLFCHDGANTVDVMDEQGIIRKLTMEELYGELQSIS